MKESYENYSELGDPTPNPWTFPTVAAVGPKGQIAIRHLDKVGEIGDVPIFVRQGEPGLSPSYAKRGWVLYEDLCHGRIPGIEADLDAWKRWQTLCSVRAQGKDLPPHMIKWHPEVYRREAKNGPVMPDLSPDELRELLPGIDIDEPDDAAEPPATKRGKGGK